MATRRVVFAGLALPKAKALAISAAVLILAAIALRFIHLGRQTIFDDEVWTQLRVTGTTQRHLAAFFNNSVTNVARWDEQYLDLRPVDASRIVRSLAVDEPQWPPLFYLMAYAAERVTGSALPAVRVLAGLFGVATVGAMAWFAYELFGSRRTALAAAVVSAASPFLLAYSREARAYTLIAACIALSGAALVRASRTERWRDWALYALTILAGVASYSLFAALIAGHGLWLLIARRDLRRFLVAVLPAAVMAAIWFGYIFPMRGPISVMLPTNGGYPLWTFVVPKWIENLAFPFYALPVWNMDWAAGVLAIVAAIAVSAVVVVRAPAGARNVLCLAAFAAPTVVALLVLDWRWHKNLALIARYELPLLLGIVLLVAALAGELFSGRMERRTAVVATAAFAAVLAGCIASSLVTVAQPWWWESWYDRDVPEIVSRIDAAPNPFVITSAGVNAEDVFANGLRRDVAVLALSGTDLTRCRSVAVPARGSELFLLGRPNSLRQEPRRQAAATAVPVVTDLAGASIAGNFERLIRSIGVPRPQPGFPEAWTAFELWRIYPRAAASSKIRVEVCF